MAVFTVKDIIMTTSIHELRPFNLRYIVREGMGIHADEERRTHRTASCNYRYILRQNGVDEVGPTPDFAARGDLIDHGRCAPLAGLDKAYEGITIWEAADDASRVRRPELATAMHAVGSLPRNGDRRSWRALVEAFGEDHLASQGMVVDWGIHVMPDDNDGFTTPPHCHWLITSRTWRGDRDPGRHQRSWLSTRPQVAGLADTWYALTGLYPVGYHKPAG